MFRLLFVYSCYREAFKSLEDMIFFFFLICRDVVNVFFGSFRNTATLSRGGSTLTHASVHSAREKWVNNDVFYYASSHSAMSSVKHPEEINLFWKHS